MDPKFKRLKFACYTVNITMSIMGNLPPLLFLTFRSLYGISYSQLGLLVFINYSTQLLVDLLFSFFSHRFNIPKTVRRTPVISFCGLFLYALSPWLFPGHIYLSLVVGTMIFSASSGLAEVLISPVIAAIPAKDPDHEMSKLHAVYAWGVVAVIFISTLFLVLFGARHWSWLVMLMTLVPLTSAILFSRTEIPAMQTPERVSGALKQLKNKTLWLCVAAIFLGGATEVTMAQWASGYLEQALGIPKVWGDIFGVALFSLMLGLGRTIYSKVGKHIERILYFGVLGSTVCYFVAAVTPSPIPGLIACALTGLCTSMLWPGNLIVASDRIPDGGVFLFAMMASGGDLGASIGPQLIGLITDTTLTAPWALSLADTLSVSPEQLGLKLGMLVGMLFPLAAIPLYRRIWKTRK